MRSHALSSIVNKRFNKNLFRELILCLKHELVPVVEKGDEDGAVDLHQVEPKTRLRYTTVDLHSEQVCVHKADDVVQQQCKSKEASLCLPSTDVAQSVTKGPKCLEPKG